MHPCHTLALLSFLSKNCDRIFPKICYYSFSVGFKLLTSLLWISNSVLCLQNCLQRIEFRLLKWENLECYSPVTQGYISTNRIWILFQMEILTLQTGNKQQITMSIGYVDKSCSQSAMQFGSKICSSISHMWKGLQALNMIEFLCIWEMFRTNLRSFFLLNYKT